MKNKTAPLLIAIALVGTGWFFYNTQPTVLTTLIERKGERSFTQSTTTTSKQTPAANDTGSKNKTDDLKTTDHSPLQLTSFADAYDRCKQVRCVVEGDAWQEYLSYKAAPENATDGSDRNGSKILALLNYLTMHLDVASNRDMAKRIILAQFAPKSQLYYSYLANFYDVTGDKKQAKATYDEYRKELGAQPELIRWEEVGKFYESIGERKLARECYEKELIHLGRREGVYEPSNREDFQRLEERISRLKLN